MFSKLKKVFNHGSLKMKNRPSLNNSTDDKRRSPSPNNKSSDNDNVIDNTIDNDKMKLKTGSIDSSSQTSSSSSMSSNNSSSYHTAITSSANDLDLLNIKKELLDGNIELNVYIKHLDTRTKFNVERTMPVYDVLLLITNRFNLNPSDYLIIADDDNNNQNQKNLNEKILKLKSNPIGLFGTDHIMIVPKLRKSHNNSVNNNSLPFVKTIRFTINLPKNQLMVKRIEPTNTTFMMIKEMICQEKSMDLNKYLLIKPIKNNQKSKIVVIDLLKTPEDYDGLNEVTLISRYNYEQLIKQFTTTTNSRRSLYMDMIDGHQSNRLYAQQKLNDWSQSTPNISSSLNRTQSDASSIMTTSTSSYRSRCFKKKPAPPPPLQQSTINSLTTAKSVQNLAVIHDDDDDDDDENVVNNLTTSSTPISTPSDSFFSSSKLKKSTTKQYVNNKKNVIKNQPKTQNTTTTTTKTKIKLNRQNSGSDSSGYHERLSQTTTEIDSPTPSTDPNLSSQSQSHHPSSLSPISNNSIDDDITTDNNELVNESGVIIAKTSSSSSTQLNMEPTTLKKSIKSNQSFNNNRHQMKKRRAPPPPPRQSSPIQQLDSLIDCNNRIESPCFTETSETSELPSSLCCSEESNQSDMKEVDFLSTDGITVDDDIQNISDNKLEPAISVIKNKTVIIKAEIHQNDDQDDDQDDDNKIELKSNNIELLNNNNNDNNNDNDNGCQNKIIIDDEDNDKVNVNDNDNVVVENVDLNSNNNENKGKQKLNDNNQNDENPEKVTVVDNNNVDLNDEQIKSELIFNELIKNCPNDDCEKEEEMNKSTNKSNSHDGGPIVIVSDWKQRSMSTSSSNSKIMKIDKNNNNDNDDVKLNGNGEKLDEQIVLNELNKTLNDECLNINNNCCDYSSDNNSSDYDNQEKHHHQLNIQSSLSSTSTTASFTSKSNDDDHHHTAKVIIKSMNDQQKNQQHRLLSSNSFAVRDGIRKFNTINQMNVSQQDLSSLSRCLSSTINNPTIVRQRSTLLKQSFHQNQNVNKINVEMPKLNRKLENFQIGSFVDNHAAAVNNNNDKNANNSKSKPSSTVIAINSMKNKTEVLNNNDNTTTKSSINNNLSKSTNNLHQTTTPTATILTTKEKTFNKNNKIRPTSIYVINNNNINNNNNDNYKMKLSKQISNGSIATTSPKSPRATDFLEELKIKSKTFGHRNDESDNDVDNDTKSDADEKLKKDTSVVPENKNEPISTTIPPPPPPPPPPSSSSSSSSSSALNLPLTKSVNRMVSTQTLPRGLNNNKQNDNYKKSATIRSISSDFSKNHCTSTDRQNALLNEIKNFQSNSQLKKVTCNEPFTFKINYH